MGFVRVHEQEASQAIAKLKEATSKLNSMKSDQASLTSKMGANVDVLSGLVAAKLSVMDQRISNLNSEILAYEQNIANKAKELDDIAYQKWLAQQRRKEE